MIGYRAGRSLPKLLAGPLRRFAKDERGVTAIEFALVLPVMLLILIGCFEVPRYVLVYQKLARTSAGVADLVAQADEPLTGNQLQDIIVAARTMMQPYDVDTDGKIYVSSINNPNGTGVVMTWQKPFGKLASSGVGTADTKLTNPAAALPVALRPAANEEVLAAEVYYHYQPIFSSLIYNGSYLYMVTYTRPRNKNLITEPSAPDSEK